MQKQLLLTKVLFYSVTLLKQSLVVYIDIFRFCTKGFPFSSQVVDNLSCCRQDSLMSSYMGTLDKSMSHLKYGIARGTHWNTCLYNLCQWYNTTPQRRKSVAGQCLLWYPCFYFFPNKIFLNTFIVGQRNLARRDLKPRYFKLSQR